jgi:hypothetical protein
MREASEMINMGSELRNWSHFLFFTSLISWYLLILVLIIRWGMFSKKIAKSKYEFIPLIVFLLFAMFYFNVGNVSVWFFG